MLKAKDLTVGMEVLVIPHPLEGLGPDFATKVSVQPKPYRGKVSSLYTPKGERVPSAAYVMQNKGKETLAHLDELFPADTPLSRRRGDRKVQPHRDPSLTFIRLDGAVRPFTLADVIRAVTKAGHPNPEKRASSIIKSLLKRGEIKIKKGANT